MRWDVGVGDECRGNGSHGDQELRAEVCSKTGDETGCCRKWDLLFDIEVEAVKLVDGYYGMKGNVVCFELL